jgi:hypothetical protein
LNLAEIVPSRSAVLVIAAWRGEPFFVRTVRKGQSLWLGGQPGDLPISPFAALDGERLRLIAFDGKQPVLSFPAEAEVSPETVTLKFGDFSLALTKVEVGRAERRRFRAAAEPASWIAAAAVVLFSTLAVLAQSLPSLGLTDEGELEHQMSIMLGPWIGSRAEPEPADPPLQLSRTPTHYLIPINGDMRCGSDVMGNPEAIAEADAYAIEGPYDNADPGLTTDRGGTPPLFAVVPHSAKIVGGNPRAPTAPWARETASGRDEESARGKLWGDRIGDANGNDALGLQRVEGGIAKALHWASAGSPETPPRVLHAGLRIQGALRPSAVTGAVASRFDRFHACYERALENRPELGGRVELRFDVGSDGRAVGATARSSTIEDQEFLSCLTASVGGLTFPAAETGDTGVTYPLFFEPGSGKRAQGLLARGEPPKDRPRSCCSR